MNTGDMETVGIEPTKGFRHEVATVAFIPLRDKWGATRAFALIDTTDEPDVGDYRWHLHNRTGHVAGMVDGVRVQLHRFLMGAIPDGYVVDHVNRWPLDNRRCNLRVVTVAQNAQNQETRGGYSDHRGVTFDKSRGLWMARGSLPGRPVTIGRYETEQEAADAARSWRAEHMPFSAEAVAA